MKRLLFFLLITIFPSLHAAEEAWISDSFVEKDGKFAGEKLGASISTYGDILAVGAPGSEDGRGKVLLYERDWAENGQWNIREELQLSGNRLSGDRFGEAVTVWRNLVAVGAPGKSGGGTVEIFSRNEGGPNQWGLLHTVDTSSGSVSFGSALAMSGDFLWVGDPGAERVNVFSRNFPALNQADIWLGNEIIESPDLVAEGMFGTSISIDTDFAVVGEPGAPDGGVAHVYRLDLGMTPRWQRVTKLSDETGEASEFGSAVSLSNGKIAIGAPDTNGDMGRAFVFERSSLVKWSLAEIFLSTSNAKDGFGESVSVLADRVAVGAPGIGSVSLFSKVGGSTLWEEVAVTPASGSPASFGSALALSPSRLFIGAPSAINSRGVASGQVKSLRQSDLTEWAVTDELEILDVRLDDLKADGAFNGISLSGDLMATQVILRDLEAGGSLIGSGVAVYRREGSGSTAEWVLEKLIRYPNGTSSNTFGDQIKIIGESLLVGEIKQFNNTTSGLFHFERHQGGTNNWGLVSTPWSNDPFASFDFDGEHLVIGTITSAPLAGVQSNPITLEQGAIVFQRTPGAAQPWKVAKELVVDPSTLPDDTRPYRFGNSVAVCGDLIVVGAPNYGGFANIDTLEGFGAAFVFRRNEGGPDEWGEIARTVGGGSAPQLGATVAIEDQRIAVSSVFAPVENSLAEGKVLLFDVSEVNNDGILPPFTTLDRTISSNFASEIFGLRLAFSNGMLAVSSIRRSTNANETFLFQADPRNETSQFRVIGVSNTDNFAIDNRRFISLSSSNAFEIHMFEPSVTPTSFLPLYEYDGWAEIYFPEAHPTLSEESTVWGKSADPDGDGSDNLEEAYFGTDPNTRNVIPLSLVPITSSFAAVTFPENLEVAGLSGKISISTNLLNWGGGILLTPEVRLGSGTYLPDGRFQWSRSVPTGGSSRRFYRIEIECE